MDFKIPKKLVDIENADKKGWHERWTENRSKDIANIPHASRICLIGGQNSGNHLYVNIYYAFTIIVI